MKDKRVFNFFHTPSGWPFLLENRKKLEKAGKRPFFSKSAGKAGIYIHFLQPVLEKLEKCPFFIWLDMSSQQSNKSDYLLVSFSGTVSRV